MDFESSLPSTEACHFEVVARGSEQNSDTAPRISVVIPVFNQEALIAACVSSVQAQTISDVEIIIVDDASTDGTADIAAALGAQDPRIRLVRSERNGGPGVARNRGIALSTGDWVALLDADDVYHPDRLRCLLETARITEADMVADNLWLCPSDRETEPELMLSDAELRGEIVLQATEFVSRNMGSGTERRDAYGFLKPILRKGFLTAHDIQYDDTRFSEDYLFYLRCLVAGAKWVVVPSPLYYYTISTNGLTHRPEREDLLRVVTAEARLLDSDIVKRDERLSAAIEKHRRSIMLSLSWSGFAEALKRRDPVGAVSNLVSSPGAFVHIGRETIRAVPRALARLANAA